MEALYPVFFTYEEVVKGNRFLACVQARGRALMVNEDGEWTMYGVQPGSFAESGETFEEARLLFRQTFREILYDLAEDSPDFQSFKVETERILGEVNDPMRERWDSAVERIRADRAQKLLRDGAHRDARRLRHAPAAEARALRVRDSVPR